MDKVFQDAAKSIGLSLDEPIKKHLTYYWLEGCKYIHFHEGVISKEGIANILDVVGEDGKSYPLNYVDR